jgi:hypothetical protein
MDIVEVQLQSSAARLLEQVKNMPSIKNTLQHLTADLAQRAAARKKTTRRGSARRK